MIDLKATIEEMRQNGMDDTTIVNALACVREVAVAAVDNAAERRRAADRERKRLLTKDWSAIRLDVIERDGTVCRYCGDQADPLHIDHIHPLSRGGGNDLGNLVVACGRCNIMKGDNTLEELGWPCP